MNYFSTLTDIFDRGIDERLELADERSLITLAQAGDETAKLRLMRAYAPALRNGVTWFTRAVPTIPQTADLEDVRSQAVMGLLEAIDAFDPETHDRLAALAASYIRNAVAVAAGPIAAFSVPERTLKRFFGILRAADGDTVRAADIAPDYEMKRETFLAVLSAVRNVDSYDALTAAEDEHGRVTKGGQSGEGSRDITAFPIAHDSIADVEDAVLVEVAFGAMDTFERDVVRLGYGFAEYDTVPDAEIAARLGYSRPKIQRTRSGALVKARSALGVA